MRALAALWPKHTAAVLSLGILLSIGLGCASKSDNEWRAELSGKKLSRASNSGAISNSVNIYFCADGRYAMERQFSGFSTGGAATLSMADEEVELGRWTVQSSTLILQSRDGERHEYGLSQANDPEVIELDGIGYLAAEHDGCDE